MSGLTHAYIRGYEGAFIDSNGFDITVSQALEVDPNDDGTGTSALTKQGTGTLTLTGVNTYRGDTNVTAGTLAVAGGGKIGRAGLFGNSLFVAGPQAAATLSGSASAVTVQNLYVGTSAGSGSFTLADGTLTTVSEVIGETNSGIFTQNGGSHLVGGLVQLGGGAVSGGNAAYNLNGGLLQTSGVLSGNGTTTFNFHGGTLQAAQDTANFMSGLTSATVGPGGAKIDSNGHAISSTQPLLHSAETATDGGLTKLGLSSLSLNAASTYNGGTTVSGGELIAGANSALGTGDVSVLGTAVRLTLSTGVTDAMADNARLTLAGGGADGVADVGYLLLHGNAEVIGTLILSSTLYTSGVFTSFTYPEYFSGLGSVIVTGAIPEPGSLSLLLAAVAAVILPRRRRRHRLLWRR